MAERYFESGSFEDLVLCETGLAGNEYEGCTFIRCNFSGVSLNGIVFSDCTFEDCNLAAVPLQKAAFRNVTFKNCRLLGLQFADCNPFLLELRFEDCQMQLCSFYQLKIPKTVFHNCQLREADFTQTDVTAGVFERCDLALAVFENSILEKADFRNAFDYVIDPTINRIRKARFSIDGVAGLLQQLDIEIS
jgi:fluoroquinolone resistance protein